MKYEEAKITDEDIINTVFEMLFKDDTEKIKISDSIKNAFLKELIEENKKKWKVKIMTNMKNISLKNLKV